MKAVAQDAIAAVTVAQDAIVAVITAANAVKTKGSVWSPFSITQFTLMLCFEIQNITVFISRNIAAFLKVFF